MKLRTFALALCVPVLSFGSLISVPTTGTVENFDSRTGCGYCFTGGPVSLPSGVVFTAGTADTNTGLGAVLGTGGYGLGNNGTWSGPYFAGVDGRTNWMLFEFPSLVSAVSGLMNYYAPTFAPPTVEVLDSSMNVLESYDLAAVAPISTPAGFNAGEWRGIVRGSADIKFMRFTNTYIVVDDLTFGGRPLNEVPEPSSAMLIAGGLGLLGLATRRFRK